MTINGCDSSTNSFILIIVGHIAYLLGKPQNSRQVGSSLKHSKEIIRQLNQESQSNGRSDLIEFLTLPWWRVLASSGKISTRANTGDEILQGNLLRNEGVPVESNSIDLDEFGWFPDDVDI